MSLMIPDQVLQAAHITPAELQREIAAKSTIWPGEVLEFTGLHDFEPFESHRDDLLPPAHDPLETLA
jgi:hypothetical protein